MANKPNKYCIKFPCRNLAVPGSSYCIEHQPARAPKKAEPFYVSVRWRRFRDCYIGNHPLCEMCQAEGRGEVPAVIVDHIVELKDGGKPLDESNAQSLCRACHNRKTATEKKKRGAIVYAY